MSYYNKNRIYAYYLSEYQPVVMNIQLKKTLILSTFILFAGKIIAQSSDTDSSVGYTKPFSPAQSYRTWSIGVNAGALSSYTMFHGKDDWKTAKASFGYGLFIKDQLIHSFGIQANFFKGQLEGSDNTVSGSPFTSYKTDINYAADISGVITLANINWGAKQSVIQPYLTLGGGFTNYLPATYTNAGIRSYPYKNGNSLNEFYIPLGAGLKFNISGAMNIDIGYQINFVNSDNIDANITGSTFDKFSYAHLGLEFALGKHTKPQLATHNPVAAMRAEYIASEAALQREIDDEKTKNAKLSNELTFTNVNLNATNASLNAINAKLSTDTDGDGVPDIFDKCPGTPAGTAVDGAGCPLPVSKQVTIITQEDRRIIKEAITNLEFDTGKATIRSASFPSLDKVAELLVTKNFSLKLAGHTDNVGSDDANLKLSKDRAEAIKSYLVAKGANPSRIEATGYGKTQPIASNKTVAGRQKNRRVEFTLF